MTDTTPRTGAPLLAAAQAQKHVTHNEALYQFDAFLCANFLSRALAAPPGTLNDGDTWLVAASATGDWAGHDGAIAYRADGGWRFYQPFAGLLAFVADESALVVYAGGAWVDYASVLALQNVPLLGVNTSADTTNKLAVKSPALLFDNIGNGVQAKFNKHAAADTASLLYQTSYSGRAELGLTGDDDFHLKVSADGASWTEALRVTSAGDAGLQAVPPHYSGYGTLAVAGSTGGNVELMAGSTEVATFQAAASGASLGTIAAAPLKFLVSNAEVARFSAGGLFGLGTSSPSGPSGSITAHIHDAASGATACLHLTNGSTTTSATRGLVLQQTGAAAYLWNFENSFFSFGVNNVEKMRLDSSSGGLLIGSTSSAGAYLLQVNSQIYATSATIATSDLRLKSAIGGALTPDLLRAIGEVPAIVYTRKDRPEDGARAGYGAQHWLQALQQVEGQGVVKPLADGLLALDEAAAHTLKIAALEARVKALEERLDA